MKKLLLTILLIALVLPASINAESKASQTASSPTPIPNSRNFTQAQKTEIDRLINDIKNEAAISIKDSWADGYKCGLLESARQNSDLQNNLNKTKVKLRKTQLKLPLYIAGSIAVGFTAGYIAKVVQ
ncbi:MAG: hypothetical protein IJR80_09155 [Treponema sp.]|nr:hypothetical protein [Treponema sp.]